jgi:hypothetical protein
MTALLVRRSKNDNSSSSATKSTLTGGEAPGNTLGPSPQVDTDESSHTPSLLPINAPSSTPTPTSAPSSMPATVAPLAFPTHEPSPLPTFVSTTETPTLSSNGEIVQGEVSNVPYLHCDVSNSPVHIVLLHGASFSKEVWMSGDMMEQFCDQVSTTALDLSVSSGNTVLQSVLNAFQDQGIIQLPVVLVTPSASGWTMYDWMINGDVQLIPDYVATWVPVEAVSITRATDEEITSIRGLVRVLTINGDGDAGERYSQRLQQLIGATPVSLAGGHAVYLDSPDEFVGAILEFEGISV